MAPRHARTSRWAWPLALGLVLGLALGSGGSAWAQESDASTPVDLGTRGGNSGADDEAPAAERPSAERPSIERPSIEEVVDRIGSALSPPADGPAPERTRLTAALDAIGPDALPGVVSVLCGAAALPELAVHPDAFLLRGEVLRDYVRRAAPADLIGPALALGSSSPNASIQRGALRFLADIEDARALDTVLELAGSLDPLVLASPSTAAIVTGAVARRLEASDEPLSLSTRDLPEALVAPVAEGISRSRRAEVIPLLTSLLGRGLDGDRAVLIRVERCARERGVEGDPWSRQSVRDALRSADPELRRAAAAAAGTLRDVEAVPPLADLLSDPDARVARTARAGLTAMAGRDLGAESAGWLTWLEAERTWLQEAWPEQARALASDDPVASRAALRAVLAHPLWRRTAAEEIAPRLRRIDPAVAGVACGVLARLGCRSAVPELVELLDAEEHGLRAAAADALRVLTGLTLPPDPTTWSEALASS